MKTEVTDSPIPTLKGYWSGLLDGPRSFFISWRLLNARSWKLFFSYTLLAMLVVGLTSFGMVSFGPSAQQMLVKYIFPEAWWTAGRLILDHVFGNLGSVVLANFILHGGMAAISICCFAVKEILSRRIEHDRSLLAYGHAVWPLWRQAVEECKFAVLYLVAYDVIFWLGYPPWGANRIAAQILSSLVLLVFFNITFMCPLFLRHRVGYGRMLRTFFTRPMASFGYAAFFLAPHLVLIQFGRNLPIGTVTVLLLVIHTLTVAPAATAGTWMAARLLETAKARKPIPKTIKKIIWIGISIFLAASGWVFLHLAQSIDQKSQILKCHYKVDFDSFSIQPPTWTDWTIKISFEIEIKNPTATDVYIENSRLVINNAGKLFSEAYLSTIEVPAGQTVKPRIELGAKIDPARLTAYKEIFSPDWEFILWVELERGFVFPIYF